MSREQLDRIIAEHALPEVAADALRAWYGGTRPKRVSGSSPTWRDGSAPAEEVSSLGAPPPLPSRYRYVDLLGVGGMGEVHRVRDLVLHRSTAMKILRPEVAENPMWTARFADEAQATAQLEHPAIVPVHDFGTLPDGRAYFTMKEVRGQTLSELAHGVHVRAHRERRWGRSTTGWTLERLLDAFRQACQGVAAAHARGVIHRDLKPDNLMIGGFGEVLVLDWGLAKVGGTPTGELEAVTLPRAGDDALKTRAGTIAGTPAYMAPEQARGEVHALTPATDVYALGSILYFLLAGRPPYGGDARTVIKAVRKTAPEPLVPLAPVQEALREICARAMAREPADRYPDAGALADDLIAYEDGAARHEKALALVQQAQDLLPSVWSLRAVARERGQQARQLAGTLKPWDPIEAKEPLWALEDAARQLGSDAGIAEARTEQLLRGALTHAPEMPEAHAVLADLYQQRHREAEAQRDADAALRYELLLGEHDRAGAYAPYLRGDGRLSLVTDPPTEVRLYRFVEEGRRLVARFERSLGRSPLREVPLERGSYLLRFDAPGHREVRYPVHIDREQHWHGVPPGGSEPFPIRLPRLGELGDDEVYVPAGWFTPGGDPELDANQLDPTPRWVDGFAIRKHPATHRDWLGFLNGLLDAGREEEALRVAPRNRGAAATDTSAIVYGRGPDGRFVLVPDPEGDVWDPDWPVFLIPHGAAEAWARWEAARTGRAWRLPGEVEWEKAARGVDGRTAPWGDHLEPLWTRARESAPKPSPARVGDLVADVSVYGAHGLAGNVADWCADSDAQGRHASRGGAWSFFVSACRPTVRRMMHADSRAETIGVRLARTLPEHRD